MRKKNNVPFPTSYPRTVDNLTRKDFEVVFDNNSSNGTVPLTWLELVSSFHMLEEEVEEWANLSPENKKIVEIYKQKCRATLIAGFKDDPRFLGEYFKEEYSHEMSAEEKLEYEAEEDNSQ